MSELHYIIILPILAGILLFAVPERARTVKGIFALLISGISLFFAIRLFPQSPGIVDLDLFPFLFSRETVMYSLLQGASEFSTYNIDNLSKFITLAVFVFGALIILYSIAYVTRERSPGNYYAWLLITLGLSAGAVLTDNLLLFIAFWGFLGLTLYKLIRGDDELSSSAAKKTLILIGSSDGIMILGIGIIWKIYGTFSISELDIPATSPIMAVAFLSLLTGSFTKAGAFPFHTWIPDFTQHAPASSSAFLPASLDKLLGIYFLTRLCTEMFRLGEWMTFLLMLLGVMTVIFAVMMALVQHNYKRMLGYCAVSQVGYIIVGLAMGTPLGIAAGLFHMINHALYKSGLFLAAGNVEARTGKKNLDELGGLSKVMPLTFLSALVCALAVSGVPPFNGFASKWLIYQGIIDFGSQAGPANSLWVLWLGLAVLGSALTLATFIKFISGIFLGRRPEGMDKVREVNVAMWLPLSLLALVCTFFGIAASQIVIPRILVPLSGEFTYPGIWDSVTVSILFLVSILLGGLIYLAGNMKRFRSEESFIGGEKAGPEHAYPVVEFYKTIREFGWLRYIYDKAEQKWFDLYELLKKITLGFSNWLSMAHTGTLTLYAVWILVGLVLMLVVIL